MIRGRLNRIRICLRLVTFLLPAVAFALAGYIGFRLGVPLLPAKGIDPAPYFALLLLALGVWAIASESLGLCSIEPLFAPGGKTRNVFLGCFFTSSAILIAAFFYRGTSFSRVFIGLSAMALFFLAIATRLGFRVLWHRQRRRQNNWIKILMIGADEYARRVAGSLTADTVTRCRVVGFVCLPDQPPAEVSAPVHEVRAIGDLALGNGFDEVILALPLSRYAEIPVLMNKLESLCVPVRAVLDFGQGVAVRERLFDLGGMLMLDLRATPTESVRYSILKRGFDLAFSLGVVIVTAPLMGLIAAVIKVTSAGPVLFVQERVGLNGRIFRMYKFRTMHVTRSEDSNTHWTVPRDPRRTNLGALLRATSLDELPQFFNVIRGDMSVVGPRPERPYFVQKFLREAALYNARHYMKVGITGWAQVNGWRGDTSISERLEYDLYYLRNWSLSFDIQIILLTLIRGFPSRNAY